MVWNFPGDEVSAVHFLAGDIENPFFPSIQNIVQLWLRATRKASQETERSRRRKENRPEGRDITCPYFLGALVAFLLKPTKLALSSQICSITFQVGLSSKINFVPQGLV